jgi:arginine decarboxylase
MILQLAAAVGAGPTELAAFDDALLQLGAANFNLVRLSSVIPPASHLTECDGAMSSPGGSWGDRLYVVYAEQRASRPGEQAWAGVGWAQDQSGRGLFVEHEGPCERYVRDQIDASLDHLQHGRNLRLGPSRRRLIGGTVVDQPICALVLCAYQTEGWGRDTATASRLLLAEQEVSSC